MKQCAVIFDMDGVLVDSYDAHYESWLAMYREQGLAYTEEDFAADFGRTSRDIMARRFGDTLNEEQIRALDQRKESLYRELLRDHFPAMDGAAELIDALSADGFALAVGSSGPPENVALCLEKLGRAAKFGAVITGSDVTRGKPDPQVFQLAAGRLGVPPERCVVIEDAVHGVTAAKRGGMQCIGITGTADRSELAGAALVVESLREITPAVVRSLIVG